MSKDFHYLSLIEISKMIRTGAASPVDVTQSLLGRIAALDPRLHAYATVMAERALDAAHQAESEIARGMRRGPLHGVPVAVKDLCFTKDAPTGAGMTIHRGRVPDYDATVVERLRRAGAVILGKLQLTEGATGHHHPDIVAPINPWGADRWTGVSSSGSGVATAAGLCYGALGSDTAGSIRFPSASCGLTGIKPTWGRVSRYGVFPLAESLDHIGPMARNAKDAAAILGAIAGADPNDPTALNAPVPNYLSGIGEGIRGLRIGIDWSYAGDVTDESVKKALEEAIRTLEKQGAIIVPVTFPVIDDVFMAGLTFFSVEVALAHETTYPARKDEYGPALAMQIELGRAAGGMDMARAQNARLAFSGKLRTLFDGIDLLAAPAIAMEVPTPDEANAMFADIEKGLPRIVRFTLPFDASGSPTITLPCGVDARGLPIGFQLVGPHLSEALIARAANAYQSVTDWHTRHPDMG